MTVDLRHIGLCVAITAGIITGTPATVAAAGTHAAPASTYDVDNDLFSVDNLEEIHYTLYEKFGSWKQLDADGYEQSPVHSGNTVTIVWYATNNFCLKGTDGQYTRYDQVHGERPAGTTCGHRPAKAKAGGSETG